jgi:hypothetical protein
MAVPNDPLERRIQPTIEEISISETADLAKGHIEGFWKSTCALVLSQDDVAKLLTQMRAAPVKEVPQEEKLPDSNLFDKLFGKKASQRDKYEKFFVVGDGPNGTTLTAIVNAKNTPNAYMAASLDQPSLVPTSAFSESQLINLHAKMEDARLGRSNVVKTLSSEDPWDQVDEMIVALGGRSKPGVK